MMTWLWVRNWFGARIGWLAAFLLAITPWAVTLSRNAEPTALVVFLVPLTLWVATWAYHRQNLTWLMALAGVLTLDLFAGPIGWLLAATIIVTGIVVLVRRRELLTASRPRLWSGGALLVGAALAAWAVVESRAAIMKLPAAVGLGAKTSALATLLMFNLRGDENFRHNFAAEPLLNAFVGLMFVAGILVAASRFSERRYRTTLILFVVLLTPAWLTTVGVPNAARAAGTLPLVVALAGIGISYMLELWYTTFPINSAARSTGQAVILLLLILSLFQGYAQYFRAWSGSGETYAAYSEPAVAAATFIKTDQSAKKTEYFVGSEDEMAVVKYLEDGARFAPLEPKGITGLPLAPGARTFVITVTARDEAVKSLSLKFPGGKLKPHLSAFSQNEIFYTYEVAQ
jgi:4-amino-4-deoxy-L-arabinose transferase-like glycosyltransferase